MMFSEIVPPKTWGHLLSQMVSWQEKQFPKATTASTLKHIKREIEKELEPNPDNLDEWVDLFFLVVQGMQKAAEVRWGDEPGREDAMIREVRKKLVENRDLRRWPGADEEGVYEHDRSQEP